MPKFFTEGKGKNRKVRPITPRGVYIVPKSAGSGQLIINDYSGASKDANIMINGFKNMAGNEKRQLAIKRATVSAANKASVEEGYPNVAQVYREAYQQMQITVSGKQGAMPESIWNKPILKAYIQDGNIHGYVYNDNRTKETDKIVLQIMRRHGLSDNEIATWMTTSHGRFAVDYMPRYPDRFKECVTKDAKKPKSWFYTLD